jgi:hypothetical protein
MGVTGALQRMLRLTNPIENLNGRYATAGTRQALVRQMVLR